MADLTGTTLGKYQVISRLGRGGMAEVYRAYQPGMDRYVAIKVMHGHMVEEVGFVERFKKEAQIVGALRHPNIVQVIDFDSQDNVYYMVMEYIQGETLSATLKQRGALPVRDALTIARKLADAVAYAHQEGMLHRDIKPANVLFTKAGEPVLTDFGIARIMGSTHMTQSGIVLGTPAYMSPEAGRGERVDERSDIYSLGIVLYEMLTGRVPFDADTPYAVIFKHITDPLPSPRTLRPEIGEAVERVVLKSLAKNLDDRYQSAADMRNGLDVALSSAPADAPDATAPYTAAQLAAPTPRATRPMDTPGAPRQAATPLATEEVRRRSPLPLILTLVALLAIGVVAILALISSQQGQAVVTPSAIAALGTSTAPTAAVSPLPSATPSASPFTTETANAIHAQSESETAAALTALATATPVPSETALPTATRTPSLSPVPPTATAIPHTSTPIPPSVTPQAVALALPTRQAVTTRVFEDINDGRLDDALTRVAPYREQFPEDPDLKLLEAFALLQFADDSTRLETARTTVESVLSADPKNGAAHFILGLYHRADPVSDPDKAAREFDLAIQNGFAIADVYWARANINRYRDVPKADVLQDFRRALELAPDNDSILIDRGIMLMYDMLDPLAALQDFEASYALVPAPWKHDLLAVAYLKLDRADDAFALYEQGAAGEVANEPHYLADGAFVALAADHPDIARQWAEKALDLNPQENDARQVLGLVAANAGDYQAALDQLGRVTPGADGQPFLNWLFSHDLKEDRARITAQMGNTDEALTLYEQVVNDFGAWWASPYLALGNLYLDTDDTEKAREYFARALEAATNMRDSESASAAEAGFTDVQILEALLEADKLLTANNAQGTLDLLSTLIGRVDPQWPDVYILMGRAQGELGQYDAARESLSRARAIAEAEGEADALAQIDEAERQLVPPQPPTGEGTPDERIDALEAYIDASGTQDIKYYIELAMLYRGVDDTGAARQTLMRGLAMLTTSGNDADARQAVLDALGTLNQPAGPTLSDDPDQRIDQLEQYTRDNQPHEVHWYIDLATLYRERGEVANARRALMRGLAMLTTSGNDPDARQAVLDALGTLNQPAGPQLSDDPDKRIEQLEQYIRDNQPREVHWYIDLAALYRERGEVANARRALMRGLAMLTTSGNDPDARQAVLDALNRLDEPSAPPEQPDLRQLIEEVEARIAETSSTNVDDYLELADLYLKAERPPYARRTLLRALHMLWGIEADAGTHQRVREALHRIDPPPFERRSDDPAAIRSDLTRYIEYWLPASELPYLELATHVQAAGDPGQARWVLLRALEMQTLIGGSADVQRHVLDMLRQIEVRGGPDASPDLPSRIGDLEAFIPAKNPNDADLYLELAALYRVQGDDDASRRTLMRALEMLDTTGNNELRVRVTEALRSLDVPLEPSGPRVDDPQAQIDALRRFIDEEKPQDVKPYLELAALYRDQGDTASARRTLMRALAMLTTSGGGQDERNAVLDALSELR